jgi:hypothetical protein
MPISIGSRIGPYEITGLIGSGGMGTVFRARDTRLNRDVAIKLLLPALAADDELLRRFHVESQSASALNHPNILTVYDVGADGHEPYLVTELLEGESLSSRLKRGKLPVAQAVDYAKQIACGLAAAHAKGIVHRDIKPDNLFITKGGAVKILDFGLAKVTSTQPRVGATISMVTSAGLIMGTAPYMSPEQARGQAVDTRSDIFSFGCVLYEMLTGTRAFPGDTLADLLTAILTTEPDLRGVDSPALVRIVGHCIEKTPEQRFQSVSDIAFALDTALITDGRPQPVAVASQPKRNRLPWALAALFALGCVTLAWLYFPPKPGLQFHRLTFRRGTVQAARFTADANSVVYSARWEDEPGEVFTTRGDSPGSRPLGFTDTALLAVSASGELALAQNTILGRNPFVRAGMLARAPLSGGAARAIEAGIDFADWSPDGKEMAVARETDRGTQLEFPVGNVLYTTPGYIGEPRVSPDGRRIAFLDHPLSNSNQGSVAVIDRAGHKKLLTAEYADAEGLAWTPQGNEIWFTAAKSGGRTDLRAVTLSGRERVVFRQSVATVLHDISRDGRVLLASIELRAKAMFRGPSDTQEKELSWLDWSLVTGISRDAKFILFNESGEGAGDDQQIYLRDTSGAPAVLLGPGGNPGWLSSDDQYVGTVTTDLHSILIYPVGPGSAQRIPIPGFELTDAGPSPDGKTLWFVGRAPGHGLRAYITDLNGASPRAVTPEGTTAMPSPDVTYFVSTPPSGKGFIYPVAGGAPQELSLSPGDRLAGWSQDGQELFVFNRNGLPAKVYRLNWKTGHRELMREIAPSDRAGTDNVNSLRVTPDGKAYTYSCIQDLSELHIVQGLK